MDEELVETDVPTVGERLRAAREEKGLNLEDIASQTRIPQRHLESLEQSAWDKLPAPTYTTGFAKSYATAVGLDRVEIGEQLRGEMGGTRLAAMAPAEVFEPADPARTMPRWLVFGAVGAVIVLVLLMSWLSRRSLEQPEDANAVAVAAEAPAPAPPAPPPVAANQPVVLTATEPVWLQVYEKGGATLFSGMLMAGQTYAVPATATAPLLKTGKPEALRINVGDAVAPPVGPPAARVSDVSLLPADLMKAGQATAAPAAPAPVAAPPATPPRAAPRPRRQRAAPPAPAPTPPPAPGPTPPTTNTGE